MSAATQLPLFDPPAGDDAPCNPQRPAWWDRLPPAAPPPIYIFVGATGRLVECSICRAVIGREEIDAHTAGHRGPGRHTPKAWYSATGDPGRVRCHRCQATVETAALAAHTAACWPEVGKPW